MRCLRNRGTKKAAAMERTATTTINSMRAKPFPFFTSFIGWLGLTISFQGVKERLSHRAQIRGFPGPELRGKGALMKQHAESGMNFEPLPFRLLQERRQEGTVDEVRDDRLLFQRFEGKTRKSRSLQSDRCCVNEQIDFPKNLVEE